MLNGDPRDGFFYPTLTLVIASYILSEGKISDIRIRCVRIFVALMRSPDNSERYQTGMQLSAGSRGC